MELETILTEAGLSGSEAKVYLTLASEGPLTVSMISKFTGMYRANLYDCLRRLVSKGFISKCSLEEFTYFEAEDPKLILDWAEERMLNLENAIPILSLKRHTNGKSKVVSSIEGSSGLFREISSMLDQNHEIVLLMDRLDLSLPSSYIFDKLNNYYRGKEFLVRIIDIGLINFPKSRGNQIALVALGMDRILILMKRNPMIILRIVDESIVRWLKAIVSLLDSDSRLQKLPDELSSFKTDVKRQVAKTE